MIVIEEADEISEEDFDNLDSSIRTTKGENTIVLMFNMPSRNHWIIRRWFNLEETPLEEYYRAIPKNLPDTEYIFATYKDNEVNLSPSAVVALESFREKNPEYYYTMICGLVGEGKKGRVYKNWQKITVKEYETLPYTEYYGLDFGYTNDPTALVGFKTHNNKIWFRQYIYETGLTNTSLAEKMTALGIDGLIVADSAEPKSIEEIKQKNFDIIPSVKGKDSIRNGIGLINQYEVAYTEDSMDIEQEIQNYIYKLDKNKLPTNEPVDEWQHALDGCRYIASYVLTHGGHDGSVITIPTQGNNTYSAVDVNNDTIKSNATSDDLYDRFAQSPYIL
jgi:phage terminase large subunit